MPGHKSAMSEMFPIGSKAVITICCSGKTHNVRGYDLALIVEQGMIGKKIVDSRITS